MIRFSIQFFAGGQLRTLGVDIVSTVEIGGVRLGLMQAVVLVVGLLAMGLVGLLLGHTRLGKQMRAYADNRSLAEVSGIDTRRIIDDHLARCPGSWPDLPASSTHRRSARSIRISA